MIRRPNTPVIILAVLILISLSLAGGGFYLFQKERAKTLDLEQKLEELNAKQRAMEAKLKESERLISDMQVKLQEAKSQIDTLGNDLQQEKTARVEALSKIEQFRADLEQQKGLRSDLEKKLSVAEEDLRKAQSQLKLLASQRTALESKIKDLETKSKEIELGNIVVNPETIQLPAEKKEETAQAPRLEGKILVINKDYNFMVINLGTKDGISSGDVFSIYHNNKYVGDAKVEKVHDAMSAAGFLSEGIKDKVNEGDEVVQKVK